MEDVLGGDDEVCFVWIELKAVDGDVVWKLELRLESLLVP